MNRISIIDTVGKGLNDEQKTAMIESFKPLPEIGEMRLTVERQEQPENTDAWIGEYLTDDGRELSIMAEINVILNKGQGFRKIANDLVKSNEDLRKTCNEVFAAIKRITELPDDRIRELLDSDFGERIAKEFAKEIRFGVFTAGFEAKYDKSTIEAAL